MSTEDKQRDIKFRGKRIDTGEWVYGSLIDKEYILNYVDGATSWPHSRGYSDVNVMCRCYEIDLKTVSQFTGLKDKNGKEIYEGDFISESGSKPYQVVLQSHSVKWIMQSGTEGICYRSMSYDYAQMNYEVIGNIYENKDLLTEK